MKRLLAQIGLIGFSVLAVVFYLPRTAIYIIMAAAILVSVIFIVFKKFRTTVFLPAVALTVFLSCLLNISYTALVVDKQTDNYAYGTHRVAATLSDESYTQYGRFYYKMKANEIDGRECNINFLLTTANELEINTFDTIEFSSSFAVNTNNYFKAKGYFLKVDSLYEDFDYNVTKTDNKPLYYYAVKIREYVRNALDSTLDKESSALCKTVFIGDKYSLDKDTKELFVKTGSTYFIVVSGMHFSVITAFFLFLFQKLFRKRKIYISLTVLLIIVYMAVTGFSGSVLRSGIMMLVALLAQTIKRDVYPPNSLGFAALVIILIYGPYCAGDIGILLSFTATYGIIKWSMPLYNKIKITKDGKIYTVLNKVFAAFCVCICANILTLPISLLAFKGISLITLLSGMVLSIPIELILILSLAIFALFYIPILTFITIPLSFLTNIICKFILWFVGFFSSFNFSFVYITDSLVYIFIAMVVILVIVMLCYTREYHLVKYVVLMAALIFCAGFASSVFLKSDTELTVFSANDDVAIMFNDDSNYAMLDLNLTSKSLSEIIEKAEQKTPKFEFIGVTKGQRATNNARIFSKEFAISKVMLYDIDSVYADKIKCENVDFFPDKYTAVFSDNITATYLRTSKCMVQYITNGNISILVIPYDTDIKEIEQEYRSADYIVLSQIPKNYALLSCNKLIISNYKNTSKLIAKELTAIYNSVMFTSDGDVILDMEVE
ncbi:MAG: ComEC/Rec2 family competence protein [Oscillospiraceae bacterium]|nr:ComEC/Rec2 family competence protein [Candidatus Ruminococcus equi]